MPMIDWKTSPIPSGALLDRVLERYGVWEGEEVREFLAAYPHLADLLMEAVAPVEADFGAGVPMNLQVLADHEGDDVVLKAYIQTHSSVEEALAKRRQFLQRWWAGKKAAAQGRLRFDVDCVESD